jgi:hypothetical protein
MSECVFHRTLQLNYSRGTESHAGGPSISKSHKSHPMLLHALLPLYPSSPCNEPGLISQRGAFSRARASIEYLKDRSWCIVNSRAQTSRLTRSSEREDSQLGGCGGMWGEWGEGILYPAYPEFLIHAGYIGSPPWFTRDAMSTPPSPLFSTA